MYTLLECNTILNLLLQQCACRRPVYGWLWGILEEVKLSCKKQVWYKVMRQTKKQQYNVFNNINGVIAWLPPLISQLFIQACKGHNPFCNSAIIAYVFPHDITCMLCPVVYITGPTVYINTV